ncbi:hypothetical protein [Spirochaeta isovalerica]|uniref:Glycosyltransferase 2-like domain-containing protein n=1 Tax=Spirochaeta isovalerica TaxID=150 RepID=A0A841R8V5_9SPIO|nr:hypothetical protein [Spirochaeta isovalerica]MBB6479158.1 hypothetical protein [Spirochaeta isovalerica]
MNTIHSTFKSESSSYTVIGGSKPDRERKEKRGLSIVLLNRGGRPFRRDLFEELTALGALEVISIEPPSVSYDLELLTRKHAELRFVLLSENVTAGERVNVGIKEAVGQYVFVLWNDMHIKASSISSRVLQKIAERENLCTVPLLQNSRNETIPSCFAPAFTDKGGIEVIPLNAVRKDLAAIYPFDYCGIYDREKFLLSGGYDSRMINPFWQKMDFGFRSHMWGEKIVANTAVKINYQNEIPFEDTTVDQSYKLFFLKTLSVRYTGDAGYLPLMGFFAYWLRTGSTLFYALREYGHARKWIRENRYRFKSDALSITELWDGEE